MKIKDGLDGAFDVLKKILAKDDPGNGTRVHWKASVDIAENIANSLEDTLSDLGLNSYEIICSVVEAIFVREYRKYGYRDPICFSSIIDVLYIFCEYGHYIEKWRRDKGYNNAYNPFLF